MPFLFVKFSSTNEVRLDYIFTISMRSNGHPPLLLACPELFMTKKENLLKQKRAASKEQESCQHSGLHKLRERADASHFHGNEDVNEETG